MAYTSIYKGVIFIEGAEQTAEILGQVEYKKLFSFNSQIQTLDCVKDQLIEQTLALGGNAIIDFKYGQKSSGWFESFLFNLDDNIKWYGSGLAVILPEETRNKIFEKLNKV